MTPGLPELHARTQYTLFGTRLGSCGIAWTERGLVRVQLPEATAAHTEARLQRLGATRCDDELPDFVVSCRGKLQRYFDGERETFAGIALDTVNVAPFNAAIYAALRTIPWGQITTYGALAELAGAPGTARAVGAAMASNPWPIIVPCHRVLAASNKIGGFSAHGGADTKRALLTLEGVHLDPPSLWDLQGSAALPAP